MLNIVSLVEAVDNSNGYYATGEPYRFYGSIHECTAEFNHRVMVEDADIQGFIMSADEIMVEAVLAHDTYRMERLSEGVFQNIADGLSKFFKSLKDLVRGLIEKIKAFLYKLTGKTSKWLSVMRPKVLDAVKLSGSTDTVYEMHKWNIQYVTTDLLAGVKTMLEFAEGTKEIPVRNRKNVEKTVKWDNPDSIQKYGELYMTSTNSEIVAANTAANLTKKDPKDAMETRRDEIRTQVKNMLDDISDAKSNFDDEWPSKIAAAVGVSGGGSVDSVWSDVARKAKGDSDEKTEVKFCSEWGVDSMLKAIDETSKTISDLKSGYDKHYAKLEKLHKNWDNALDKFKVKDESKMDNTATSEIRSFLTAAVGYITHQISACETAANTARGANIKFVENMSHEFMNALTKLASYKAEKK